MACFLSFSSGRFRVLIYCTLGQLVQVFYSWPLSISQLLPPEHCQAKQGSPRHRPAACRPGHRQADELSYVHQTNQTRMRQTAGLNSQVTTPTWMFPMESQVHPPSTWSSTYTHPPNKEVVRGLSSVNAVSTCPRGQRHKQSRAILGP